jgi:hypothetical protein
MRPRRPCGSSRPADALRPLRGIRGSKLLVTGAFLASLPNAEVIALAQ